MTVETNSRAEFLTAMRTVSNTVSVVTTDGKSGRHGATVSAFCSVSADPPTVLICLKSDSNIAKYVCENKSFCLNILPNTDEATAKRFAGGEDEQFPNRFEGIAIEETREGPPIIHGATSFQCELKSAIDSGSHIICIGEVTSSNTSNAQPLVYHQGKYKNLVSKDELNKTDTNKVIPMGERRNGRT